MTKLIDKDVSRQSFSDIFKINGVGNSFKNTDNLNFKKISLHNIFPIKESDI